MDLRSFRPGSFRKRNRAETDWDKPGKLATAGVTPCFGVDLRGSVVEYPFPCLILRPRLAGDADNHAKPCLRDRGAGTHSMIFRG